MSDNISNMSGGFSNLKLVKLCVREKMQLPKSHLTTGTSTACPWKSPRVIPLSKLFQAVEGYMGFILILSMQEDGTTLAMHFAPTYQQVDWEGKAKGQRAQNQGGASQARQTAVISHKPKFGNAMWGMLWSRHHPTVCGV